MLPERRRVTVLLVRGDVWSGAGSNCRPSAFQVNRAERCADLQKRMSLTSGTALCGRCKIHASRTQNTPSIRHGGDATAVKTSSSPSLPVDRNAIRCKAQALVTSGSSLRHCNAGQVCGQ